MGDSRKYPYHTTDGLHVLIPPCLRKFQNALPPVPSEFHNCEPPPRPLQNFPFFWKYIFNLATPIRTNEHEYFYCLLVWRVRTGRKNSSKHGKNGKKTTQRATSAIWRIFAELDKPKRALSKMNWTSMDRRR